MPGKLIWKQNKSANAIFKQDLDSTVLYLQCRSVFFFIQNICLVCVSAMFVLKTDFKFFCKGNTWNYKTGESLTVILNHIRAQMG